jgi:uncharacterized repeat protein (TIGR01451 family)
MMKSRAKSGTLVVLLLLTSSLLAPVVPFGLGETHTAKAITAPWAMFGNDRLHSGLASQPAKGIKDPFMAWGNVPPTCWGSTIADFRKNIYYENVSTYTRPGLHGVYSRGNLLQVVEGLSGVTMWQVTLGASIQASTGLTDTDRDGHVEIAVATMGGEVSLFEPTIRWNGTAYRYNQTAAMADRLWSQALTESVTYSSIAVGDITGDGTDDIVLAGQVRAWALNGTSGQKLWFYNLTGSVTGTPAILDFGQNLRRIALSSFNLTAHKLFISMLNSAGQELWTKNLTATVGVPPQVETILPSVSAGDIDGDGAQELIVASPFETGDGRIQAYKLDGTLVWASPFQAKGMIESTPAIADLDKDGKADIVAISWNVESLDSQGHAYAIDGVTGTEIWNATLNRYPTNMTNDKVVSSPALVDMNGDKVPDAIIPSYNGRIYALNGSSGKELWHLDTNHPTLYSSPAVADMDGNGIIDIFVDGMVIVHKISELSIGDSDITIDNMNPDEGTTVHINAVVYDTGTKDAKNVTVRFEDTYDRVTTLLGNVVINITSHNTAGAAMAYMVNGGGDHKITVTVDPNDQIEELDKTNNAASKTFKVSSHWSLVLSSSPSTIVIDPGQQATYTIKVKNTGDRQNIVNLAVPTTLPQGWSKSLTKSQLTLDPSEEQSVGLIMTTSSSTMAGQYAIDVTGTSQNKTTNHNTTQVITALRGEFGVLLRSDKTEKNTNPEGFAAFDINVTNFGNSPDTMMLFNSSPVNSTWYVFVSQDSVNIPAGGHKTVTLTVKPSTSAMVGASEAITVLAKSTGNPAMTDHMTFITHVVYPDLTVQGITFYRNDWTQVDGTNKHLIGNRTSHVNISVSNLLGNIDFIQSVYLELSVDGAITGQAFVDINGSHVANGTVNLGFKVGHHTVKACVNANNFLKETNMTNDCLTVQVTAKSDTAVGTYRVHGTIFWPTGAKVANADVAVTNLRTNESLALKSDGQGNYTMDLKSLPSSYIEEEQVSVKATNGVTVRERTFLAYSEDGGKQVDIVMVPQPYDFFIGPQVKISTTPGHPAFFAMYIDQLGNATNNISLAITGVPKGWNTTIMDQYSDVVKVVKVVQGQLFNLSINVTPAADAKVNTAGVILTLTGTSLNQTDKKYSVSLIVGILQVHQLNYTKTGANALVGTTVFLNLSVTNAGNGDEVATPSVGNNAQGWPVRFSTQKLNLTYKATKDLGIQVDVPENSSIGIYHIGISLAYGDSQRLDVDVPIDVMDYDYSIEVRNNDMNSKDIEPGQSVSFSIAVANKGNIGNSVSLVITGAPNGWTAGMTDLIGTPVSQVDVAAGKSAALLFKVTAAAQTSGLRNVVINITGISLMDPDKRSTAFALMSVVAPDLMIASNVTFSKKPVDGSAVEIIVVVKNIGTAAAKGTTATFLVDGKSIGTSPIDYLEKKAVTNVSIIWKPKAGTHTVKVEINPDHTLVEMNYGNNVIQTTVDVASPAPAFTLASVMLLLLLVAVALIVMIYFVRPDLLGIHKPKKRRPRPAEEEEEESSEEEAPEEEEEPEEEEVHEAEVLDEEEEEPARIKTVHKTKKPKKKVARPMTFAEKYKPEEDDRDTDIDDEDLGSVIRIR